MTESRSSAASSTMLATRLSRVGALAGIWITVGAISATQIFLWRIWSVDREMAGGLSDFLTLLARQVRNALPWIPVTLAVFAVARRFPLRSMGLSRWLLMHSLLGVLTVVLLNVVQAAMHWMVDGPMTIYNGWWDAVVSETLLWGQTAFVVYGVLVAIGWFLIERRADRLDEQWRSANDRATTVEIRAGNTVRFVTPAEIDWIEGAGDYARLHVRDQSYLCSDRLSVLENRLAASGHFRIHRSTIVNLERVVGYASARHGDYVVELRDGTRLKASRRYRAVLDTIKERAGQ